MKIVDYSQKYTFFGCLIGFLSFFLVLPLVPKESFEILFGLSISIVLLSSIYFAKFNRIAFWIAIFLLLPAILGNWIAYFSEAGIIQRVSLLSNLLFFTYVILLLGYRLFASSVVDANVIAGAITIYLLVGFEFGFLYSFLELIKPHSFEFLYQADTYAIQHDQISIAEQKVLIYYSFITLTTVGFGDIIPLSDAARSFSVLQSVTRVKCISLCWSRDLWGYIWCRNMDIIKAFSYYFVAELLLIQSELAD